MFLDLEGMTSNAALSPANGMAKNTNLAMCLLLTGVYIQAVLSQNHTMP